MAESNDAATESTEAKSNADRVRFWTDQIAAYNRDFKDWESRCNKIVKRYRDDRDDRFLGARFNALWSNVQTLQPAIYIKAPKPVAERRFLDKDPMARLASMTLERSMVVQIEQGGLHEAANKSVLDYLLCGRGVVWERYEPTYGDPEDLGEDDSGDDDTETVADAPRPVTYEKVATDYVYWKNFAHSPSPVWEEVWWVAKKEGLTRRELRARFTEKDKETGKPIADMIPLKAPQADDKDKSKSTKQMVADIWEIWDKRDRKVIFIAPDWPERILEENDDPLGLDKFWPCPPPLYGTLTHDTLVPVPDYAEYQDQADELDSLTSRIRSLTDAVKVVGLYDASIAELKRLLSEGVANKMIGVKNWSAFSQTGGLKGSVDFFPLKDVVEALIQLYDAREKTKQDMYEITGISDIMRGQGAASETATAQRIKGQFGTLRLQIRQTEVQRFIRDTIRIAAEIIAEQFSPEILSDMTGMIPFIEDEIRNEPKPAAPAMPSPMMGHNGGTPMGMPPGAMPPPGQPPQPASPPGLLPPQVQGANLGGAPHPAAEALPPAMPPLDPEIAIKAEAQRRFSAAVDLLKNDKMRTFRIDIETDSTIEVDKQESQKAVVDMFTAVGGFLEKSAMIGQMVPEMVPALGQSILFAFRRFGTGRDIESAWEQAIEQIGQKAKNPPPPQPSPEQIKAQAEAQKQEQESQREQARFQMEQAQAQQQAQRDAEKQQADMAMKQQEMELNRQSKEMDLHFRERELAFKERELQMNLAAKAQEGQIKEQGMVRKAAIEESADVRAAEAGERSHELNLETMELKAKQAKEKPKKGD